METHRARTDHDSPDFFYVVRTARVEALGTERAGYRDTVVLVLCGCILHSTQLWTDGITVRWYERGHYLPCKPLYRHYVYTIYLYIYIYICILPYVYLYIDMYVYVYIYTQICTIARAGR